MGDLSINGMAASYQDVARLAQRTEVRQNVGENCHLQAGVKTAGSGTPPVAKMTGSGQDIIEEKNSRKSDKRFEDENSKEGKRVKFKSTGREYTYHKEVNRIAIKVYDRDTKEVIIEIPSKESLERIEAARKVIEKGMGAPGLILDERR